MDDFEKGMQFLIIAKMAALEKALESHLPEVHLLYRELLKTSVESYFRQGLFDGSPLLKDEVKKEFGL